jgi:hypothetical protein
MPRSMEWKEFQRSRTLFPDWNKYQDPLGKGDPVLMYSLN